MEGSRKKIRKKQMTIIMAVLLTCLILTAFFIMTEFVGVNTSVEYERSVFISQLAEQMKRNLITSREYHLINTKRLAAVLDEVRPTTFEQMRRLFPEYADSAVLDGLFFLSSDCELYGIDGRKKMVTLPYEGYFLDVLSRESTTAFFRIEMKQEYMLYSACLHSPLMIDGQEIAALLFGWNSSQYRSALSSKLFEEKSSSLLIEKNGAIMIYPEEEENGEAYGYNIFSYLEAQGMSESELLKLREMVEKEEDQTILCEVEGNRWLFSIAYYDEQYRVFIMLPIQNTSAGTYEHLYGLIGGVILSFLLLLLIVGAIMMAALLRQRQQREKELQTELLMRTARTKNEFLAKMSHDIRTPLNGIIGMNYIAAAELPPECKEVRKKLEKVDGAAKYLLSILNDILDMSKIESGKLTLSAKPFSMETVLAEVEALMEFQAKEKAFLFTVEVPEPTDYDYMGDELRLKQILINLLSNAVKFTNEGSVALEVTTRPKAGEYDEVVFVIRDTGKGMSKEFVEQLFVPFNQEDESIAAQYGGSGLGLAITKSLVDLMGGTITASSEPERGSEFIVTLLLKKTEKVEKTAAAGVKEEACDFTGRRVLLCEDNEINAEIAKGILEQYGLSVDWAEDGRAGVKLFADAKAGYYDIIFMDVRMPEMDGYEATRIIRGMERTDARKMPICALSANSFSEDIAQSRDAGMNEHLSKPIDISRLTEILKKYLG